MFFGEFRIVAKERNPVPGAILYTFHERSAEIRGAEVERKIVKNYLQDISMYVKFTMGSSYANMESDLPSGNIFCYGVIQPDMGYNYINIQLHMAIDMLLPLIGDDLTNARRYGC